MGFKGLKTMLIRQRQKVSLAELLENVNIRHIGLDFECFCYMIERIFRAIENSTGFSEFLGQEALKLGQKLSQKSKKAKSKAQTKIEKNIRNLQKQTHQMVSKYQKLCEQLLITIDETISFVQNVEIQEIGENEEFIIDENSNVEELIRFLTFKIYQEELKVPEQAKAQIITREQIVALVVEQFQRANVQITFVRDGNQQPPLKQIVLQRRKEEKAKQDQIMKEIEEKMMLQQQQIEDQQIKLDEMIKLQEPEVCQEEIESETEQEGAMSEDSLEEPKDSNVELTDDQIAKRIAKSQNKKQLQLEKLISKIKESKIKLDTLSGQLQKQRQIDAQKLQVDAQKAIKVDMLKTFQTQNNYDRQNPKQARDAVQKFCKNAGIITIYAPFEGDFQLAAMNRTGLIQAVMSNDTDQIVLGCDIIFEFDNIEEWILSQSIYQSNIGVIKELQATVSRFDEQFEQLKQLYTKDVQLDVNVFYNPLNNQLLQKKFPELGSGTTFLRRVMMMLILLNGNDYLPKLSEEFQCLSFKTLSNVLQSIILGRNVNLPDIDPSKIDQKKQQLQQLFGAAIDEKLEFLKQMEKIQNCLQAEAIEISSKVDLQILLQILNQPEKIGKKQCLQAIYAAQLFQDFKQGLLKKYEADEVYSSFNRTQQKQYRQLISLNEAKMKFVCEQLDIQVEDVTNLKANAEKIIDILTKVKKYSKIAKQHELAEQQLDCVEVQCCDGELEEEIEEDEEPEQDKVENQQNQRFEVFSANQLSEFFNDVTQDVELARVQRFLLTGQFTINDQTLHINQFIASQLTDYDLIKLIQLEKSLQQSDLSEEQKAHSLASLNVQFLGANFYASSFKQVMQIYSSTPVYHLLQDQYYHLHDYYIAQFTNPNNVNVRQAFQADYTQIVVDPETFGQFELAKSKLWTLKTFRIVYKLNITKQQARNCKMRFVKYLGDNEIIPNKFACIVRIVEANGIAEDQAGFDEQIIGMGLLTNYISELSQKGMMPGRTYKK